MLLKALNIHWTTLTTNVQLYEELPAVANKIASRTLKLAGHCYRYPELSSQKLDTGGADRPELMMDSQV